MSVMCACMCLSVSLYECLACVFLLVSHVYVSLCQLCFLLFFVCLLCVCHVCIYVPICMSACTCIFVYISAFAPVVHVCICMFVSACDPMCISLHAPAVCMSAYMCPCMCMSAVLLTHRKKIETEWGVEVPDTPQMSISLLSSEGRAAGPLTPS